MIENIFYYLLIIYLTSVDANYYGHEFASKDFPYQVGQNFEKQFSDIRNNIPESIETNRYRQAYQLEQGRVANEDENWPESDLKKIGQISGVAVCPEGNVHLFHRADVVWDQTSFDGNNIYKYKDRGAIPNDTIIVLDSTNGKIVKSWGNKKFYMPHGISFDPQGNIWLTDVALHQVFRFKPNQLDKPDLVLGEAFVPGNDEKHFCKPTDIAISSSGIIYISDGYCNSRIVVFSPEGNYIGQFGTTDGMFVPHSLTLLELEDLLCVADRENRRILCYTAGLTGERHTGRLVFNVQHRRLNRVFAIDHIGDVIVAANGGDGTAASIEGVSLDLATEQLVDVWKPKSNQFVSPHDIAVSNNGLSFFVTDLGSPKKLYKFNI